jgi:hypothetical protein
MLKRLGLLALAVLTIGSVVGCGSGSDGGDSTSTDPGRIGSTKGAPPPEASDPPAPGFTDSSGVTDIPAFGVEADAAQRPRASSVVSRYLEALEREEWKKACSELAISPAGQLRQLVAKVKSIADKSCGEGLRVLVKTAPPSQKKQLYFGPVDVVALRIKHGGGAGEGAGFALFHGNDGTDYWASVRLEEGEWKVTSFAAQPLH